MVINLPIDINKVKGFMYPSEGNALYSYAKEFTSKGDALEIGSYCGKSAVYIGSAVKENKRKLYSIDHHKGSEEQQTCIAKNLSLSLKREFYNKTPSHNTGHGTGAHWH